MSQGIVLVTPLDVDLRFLEYRLPVAWAPKFSRFEDGLYYADANEYMTLRDPGDREAGEAEYTSSYLYRPSARKVAWGKRFYIFSFNCFTTVRRFLSDFLPSIEQHLKETLIEDDYGELEPASEFLARLQVDPNWDWRKIKSWHVVFVSRNQIDWKELCEPLHTTFSGLVEMDETHHEVVMGRGPDGPSIVLYPMEMDPGSPEDPILAELLTESMNFQVLGNSCFVLRFSDLALAKRVLRVCLDFLKRRGCEVFVDFDRGTAMSGEDTLEWLRLEPDWDWR